ncbi:MAG: efflux RND transporter periplasmic adaptor subunit, partial [Polyangiaceae bacterium]
VLAFGSIAGCKQATADSSATEAPTIAPDTALVTEVEVPETLRLTGSLKGDRETDLAANIAGRIVSTSVERGAEVKTGQVLAQVDVRAAALTASEANVQVENAQAQATQAQSDCARYEQLKKKGAITDLEYDKVAITCRTMPLNVEAASARARLAAQNVGDGTIRAPFAGIVTERYIELGEYVRSDSRVVTIVSVDPLRLVLLVPEADAGKVKQGAVVAFKVAAYPGRSFSGKVRFVSGAIRETTRDLAVEAIVENTDRALKPGMFADVELNVGTRKVPGVPKLATFDKNGTKHAFFVIDGKLQERVLSTGVEVNGFVSVNKGAAIGERAAVGDVKTFANGQRVR